MRYVARDSIATYEAPGPERLRRLADFLDGVPDDRLTLARWYALGSGCAIGLAITHDAWFQAQGLRLERAGSLKECRPVYRAATDWAAIADFFAISLDDAAALFTPAGYDGAVRPGARRMTRRIHGYLAQQARVPIAA